MILIDKNTKTGWSHMVGTTIPELHEFAERIGLKRHWFENKRGKNRPHYDVKGEFFERALESGALFVSSKDIVSFFKENYGKN